MLRIVSSAVLCNVQGLHIIQSADLNHCREQLMIPVSASSSTSHHHLLSNIAGTCMMIKEGDCLTEVSGNAIDRHTCFHRKTRSQDCGEIEAIWGEQ